MAQISPMNDEVASLRCQIEDELAAFGDATIVAVIRHQLIAPKPIALSWDYGPPLDDVLSGWSVFEDVIAGARIVYCPTGFGPKCTWGLVSLIDETPSMGMDSGWFPTFLDAYFDSFSATRLPIYQVVQTNPDGTQTFRTEEGGWDDAWAEVEKLRSTGEVPVLDLTTLRHSHPRYDVITRRYPRP
jgi:hypothetical protein